jgi:oligopeptide transport system ATP-binding protein
MRSIPVIAERTPDGPVLAVEGLGVEFATRDGRLVAVEDFSLSIGAGECVGVVGESAAGKSQALLAVGGLLATNAHTRGSARLHGEELLGSPRQRLDAIRGAQLAYVFQDPMTSLTPHLRIGRQIAEPLMRHLGLDAAAAQERALVLLERVGLGDAALRIHQYPHELSGGMRQRVMLAIALACNPPLLIADEPTTALDVTVQAQILALLADLKRERRMSMVVVSHDFGVIAAIADRVVVMYAGRIVECGSVADVLAAPLHRYTLALLRAMPRLDGDRNASLVAIAGQPPDPRARPAGCAFHPRCAQADARCAQERPALRPLAGRMVACHHPAGRGEA